MLNKDKVVVEILEDIDADDDVIIAIKELKEAGYTIALDDFVLTDNTRELISHADIIKVDFMQSRLEERNEIVRTAKKYNCKLLAEKVETRNDFRTAVDEGFDYFQGYFFSKPVILKTHDVPSYQAHYFTLLAELNKAEPDIDKITSYIERDLSLSYKLLKIVNTVAYYTRVQISSIRQAVLVLGLNELKKWVTILSLKGQNQSPSLNSEVLVNSLIRAKLAESIGENLFGFEKKSECFMLGLFSLLEAILQTPKEKVVENLPLSEEVKQSLLGFKSDYNIILNMIVAIEEADWVELERYSYLISTITLSQSYKEAIKWATDITKTVT
ncbi:MAG: HDOD domain-containing protein [Bacillaceae bacterium]|nr:HDOD domain-containing protein [Bacillaceae bacterium]